jgi:hypothetical protein
MRTTQLTLLLLLLGVANASAQLAVTVAPVKLAGQKAVVSLALSNGLPQRIESARAVCFLVDDQGKLVGQSTRWVLGGSTTNVLAAGSTNSFYFVIAGNKPLPRTTLSAKVSFTRVVLANGKLADPIKDIAIVNREAPR